MTTETISPISLSIRRFEPAAKQALRIRAAHNRRSMEEEARQILYEVLLKAQSAEAVKPPNLFTLLRGRVEEVGGIDLPDFDRSEPQRPPLNFD